MLQRDENLKFKSVDACNNYSDFYEKHVQISHCKSIELFMKTLGQMNDLWKKARKLRITGSICYEIYTYSDNKKADWKKKFKNVFLSDFEGNASTNHGIINEDNALKKYEQVFQVKIEKTGLLVRPSCPWMGYSADGVVWTSKVLIEVKCPVDGKDKTISEILSKLSYLELVNGVYIFKQKHKYYAQVQLGMMLLGFEKCHFIIYSSFDDSFIVFEISYNSTFSENMFNVLKCTYFNHILPCIKENQKTN